MGGVYLWLAITIFMEVSMKTKEVKRIEAANRTNNKVSDSEQLFMLNTFRFRAKKERIKIAKRLGILYEDTFQCNITGNDLHHLCIR